MDHQIKALSEAITNKHISGLVRDHVKSFKFNDETRHLTIYMNNAAPMHELEGKEGDEHLRKGLEKVFGDDITYEIKMHGETPHERDKVVSHRRGGY